MLHGEPSCYIITAAEKKVFPVVSNHHAVEMVRE
jgi:hypothetical protein